MATKKKKTTEDLNPNYFTTHETKEGKPRYGHTYASHKDALTWLTWIFKIPQLFKTIQEHEARISRLESLH